MRRLGTLLTLAVVALTTVGCKGEPPSAEAVRYEIERAMPGAEFRRDSRIHLGRFTLGVAKGVMRLVAFEDRETRRALSQVRSVDISSYDVVSMPELGTLVVPPRFERAMAAEGWYPMVKTREVDELSWIYAREQVPGKITNIYIVELDREELMVIDLAGRLDRVTAQLVADDPDGFVGELGD